MKKILLLIILTMNAFAANGDMLVRLRGLNVMPDESGTPTVVGGEVKLNNESVPEIDFTYFLSDALALELIVATATHEASVYKASGNSTLVKIQELWQQLTMTMPLVMLFKLVEIMK